MLLTQRTRNGSFTATSSPPISSSRSVATLRDEDIGGLDVAVNDPFRVRCVKSIRHFYRDLKQAIHFHRLARNQVLQCCAIEILHDDECLPVLLADIVNRADVGMIQCRSGFGFTAKSFQGLTV